MSKYFMWFGYTEPFQLFSTSHLIALSVLLAFYIGFVISQKYWPISPKIEPTIRKSIAAILIIQEIRVCQEFCAFAL